MVTVDPVVGRHVADGFRKPLVVGVRHEAGDGAF